MLQPVLAVFVRCLICQFDCDGKVTITSSCCFRHGCSWLTTFYSFIDAVFPFCWCSLGFAYDIILVFLLLHVLMQASRDQQSFCDRLCCCTVLSVLFSSLWCSVLSFAPGEPIINSTFNQAVLFVSVAAGRRKSQLCSQFLTMVSTSIQLSRNHHQHLNH